MKGTIKSFRVWKTAKIAAIVVFILLALPSCFFLMLITAARIKHQFHSKGPDDFRISFILFSVMPFLYGILAFIGAALASWLYNIISPRFGGIEVDIALVDPASSRTVQPDPA